MAKTWHEADYPIKPLAAESDRPLRVDWHAYMPARLAQDYQVAPIDPETFLGFVREHYSAIFRLSADDAVFGALDVSPRKLAFYRREADLFGFRDDSGLVGVFAGHAIDWSTYYLRTAGLLAPHQGRGIWQEFLQLLFTALRHEGFERVEGDVTPANRGQVHLFNKIGFVATGHIVTERWGAMTRYTRYLSDVHEKEFRGRFCMGYGG